MNKQALRHLEALERRRDYLAGQNTRNDRAAAEEHALVWATTALRGLDERHRPVTDDGVTVHCADDGSPWPCAVAAVLGAPEVSVALRDLANTP